MQSLTWVVWANSQFALFFHFFPIFLVFFTKATGRIVRQIWTNEGSKRVVPRKEVPFEDLNDVPYFFARNPQKTEVLGHERQKIQILKT